MSAAIAPEVETLQRYLRINTMQPNVDYGECVEFLKGIAKELEMEFSTFEYSKGKPFVLLTRRGKEPKLKSIILNSHTDVVPVFLEKWHYDPFAAERVLDKEGLYRIYARGSQDMKVVGVSYIEAMRRLKGVNFPRTIHMLFTPEEEVAGLLGMKLLVEDQARLDQLNIGIVLDEGIANPGEGFKVFYGERVPWWLRAYAEGNVGHGSQFVKDTAISKLMPVLNHLLEFRKEEEKKLTSTPGLTLGEVTTVNVTGMKGGVAHNVVPKLMEIEFDIRMSPLYDVDKFQGQLKELAQKSGVNLEDVSYMGKIPPSSIEPTYKWWSLISQVFQKRGVKYHTEIFPANTDSRYLRNKGYPAYGISPLHHTPVLLHDHDEFIYEHVFLEGIPFYEDLISALASDSHDLNPSSE